MQTREATHTLLEAQDIHVTTNFRDRAPAGRCDRLAARPRVALHDFLVLSQRPDLTPELFATAGTTAAPVQSCERNMPAK